MKLSKFSNKVKKSTFICSFKSIDSRLINALLWDIAWLLVILGILALTTSMLKDNLSNVPALAPELSKLVGEVSFEEPPSTTEMIWISSVLIKAALTAAAAVISMIAVSAFLRSLVWSKILTKRIDKGYLKRFFLLKIVWIISWLLLAVLFAVILKPDASRWIIGIMAAVYLHLTVVLHSLFEKKKAVFAMIKKAFAIGIKKFHLFIIPYILAIAVLCIISLIVYPIILLQIDRIALITISIILFLVFTAWLRLYVVMTVEKIEKS